MAQDIHIAAFLDALSAEQGSAVKTLAAYETDLSDADFLLQAKGQSLSSATIEGLRGLMGQWKARQLAPRTTARRLSALRGFYAYLCAEGLRDDNPSATLSSPKVALSLPVSLSEQEVALMIDGAQNLPSPEQALMMTAGLELLYATGLRISELLSLRESAILSHSAGTREKSLTKQSYSHSLGA